MINALHFKARVAGAVQAKDIVLIGFNTSTHGMGYVAHEVEHVEKDGREIVLTLRDGGVRVTGRYDRDAVLLVHRWDR